MYNTKEKCMEIAADLNSCVRKEERHSTRSPDIQGCLPLR